MPRSQGLRDRADGAEGASAPVAARREAATSAGPPTPASSGRVATAGELHGAVVDRPETQREDVEDARPSKLETTRGHVHLAAEQAAREVAAMWGDARAPNLPQMTPNGGDAVLADTKTATIGPMARVLRLLALTSITACGDSVATSATDSGSAPTSGATVGTSVGPATESAGETVASASTADEPTTPTTTALTTTGTTGTTGTTTAALPSTDTGDSSAASSLAGASTSETSDTNATPGTNDPSGDATTTTGGDACGLTPLPAGSTEVIGACGGNQAKVVVDPYDLAVEWQKPLGGGDYPGSYQMPVVGVLTDDDGDGDVDSDDDVVVVAVTSLIDGGLRVMRGVDGSTVFEVPGILGSGPALADVDSDGDPEIVAITMGREIVAISNTGEIEWKSMIFKDGWVQNQVTVSDLDGDGDVEVLTKFAILDGATGALIAELKGTGWYTPIPADLDLDGKKEIAMRHRVLSSAGAVLWSLQFSDSPMFGAVLNMDADPEAEVMMNNSLGLHMRQHDGTPIAVYAAPADHSMGPPCVADFDGDGLVEIGVPAGTTLGVINLDGTYLWKVLTKDATGSAGCSAYDVEGDGAYELFYADEELFRIYNGKTGVPLYTNGSDHNSATNYEYPVIADVDKDGSAEIVLSSTTYNMVFNPHGITVIGHVDDGWSAAGQYWGIHDFAVTNINPDGSVPATYDPPWVTHNLFRARPTVDPPRADLRVDITASCVDCASEAQVAYQVCNQGGSDVAEGVPLTLFALADMVEVAVETRVLPAVPAGKCLAGDAFTFDPALLVDGGVVLRLHDDGNAVVGGGDCSRANDAVAADLVGC